ncbi:MAG: 3-methyl-2-oxobutanoate dehydrogenase subunit VorB [Armatimonadetes bacterium]|nr:3-methyl-2-oxobutanoate dehydrogenase subunit VorB [Armatimonadota bacterium]
MALTRGERILMRGNEAIAQAAIDAGCRAFFGYPITPQNQIPDYFARYMPEVGGVFLQAESEVAAISMVYGAAAAGVRVMTASSSPGVSLAQEGISYLAESELPCVIVNIMRGGSGLGNIAPAQSDYFQSVKGGGHGDYRTFVLAPWSVQELYDLTRDAFDFAERYRNPVLVLGDALLGQMMEPMIIPEEVVDPQSLPRPPWATDGAAGREKRNIINSLYIKAPDLEQVNQRLQERYDQAAATDVRFSEEYMEEAEIAIVAYGTAARVTVTAIEEARNAGLKVGLFRPVTLYPFPEKQIALISRRVKAILVVELSLGQLVEDVRLAVSGQCPVELLARTGGVVMTPAEVVEVIARLARGVEA